MEPLLLEIEVASDEYVRARQLYETGPADKRAWYKKRMEKQDKTLCRLMESYEGGWLLVESIVASNYIEYKVLRADKQREAGEWAQHYDTISDAAISHLNSIQ
jgi:hypothetical protein